jgi:intracellular sulfur oxidation DsrE/DsrF family protein
MRKLTLLFCFAIAAFIVNAQKHNLDSTIRVLKFQQDSTLRAKIHADSAKVNKSFADKIRWAKLQDGEIYPVLNAGIYSGVIPVKDPTEVPDTTQEYKLLFEVTSSNPDSTASEINTSLVEVARVINLHVASGVSLKKIHVVIVMHGGGIRIVTDNATYKEHFRTDNPNIKLIDQLSAIGARFIVCGQSVAYGNVKRETFLPQVKVSLTAQTVLTNYQLKGYVKNTIQNN